MPPDSEICNVDKDKTRKNVLFRCCCGTMNFNNVHIYLSLFCNFVFAVLFIAVFVMLGDMKAKYDQAVHEINNLVQHLPLQPTPQSQSLLKPYHRDKLYRIHDISNGTFYAELGNRTEEIIRKIATEHVERRSITPEPTKGTEPPSKEERRKRRKELRNSCMKIFRCSDHRGLPGPPGPKGEKGDKGRGKPGRTGMPGLQGAAGLPGQSGLPGPKGSKGVKGDFGERGHQGEKGERGLSGKQGPQGIVGPMGLKGEKGDSGAKGEKGDTGSLQNVKRPSAHLTGYTKAQGSSPHSASSSNNPTEILNSWEDDRGLAHTTGGMQYDHKGDLVIPVAGHYFVYSQIYFQVRSNSTSFVIHYMYRTTTKNQQTIIMRSIISRCRARRGKLYLFSGYQGGVFLLNKGDKLSVGVSEPKITSTEESASFFGAFLIL